MISKVGGWLYQEITPTQTGVCEYLERQGHFYLDFEKLGRVQAL